MATKTDAEPLISLVVPFFNEAEGVDTFYQGVAPILDRVADARFEIVCVDDGSRDNTLARLIALAQRDARIRIVELSRNFGKEAALTAGIDFADGESVIPFDADLQDPPEVIPELIEKWRQGYDVVLARRIDRSSDSFLKSSTAGLFYRVHNRLASVSIPQDVGDFRLMDRSAVTALRQLPERQRFLKGLFAWVGFKATTIDYVRAPRAAGRTKFSGWKLWNLALEGITSFSTAPLKIWMYIGFAGAFIAFLYAAFIAFRTLIRGIEVPGYASLLVAILFFGSVQLISIGVLGEYVGRIYMETKQRPPYLVRKHHGIRSAS